MPTCKSQGLIVRLVAGYKLPHCLRITVGDEVFVPAGRPCRRTVQGPALMAVIYNRVALIGLGLIASSMAHAMRTGRAGGADRWLCQVCRNARRRAGAWLLRRRDRDGGKGSGRGRPCGAGRAGRGNGCAGGRNRAAPCAGGDGHGCRFGQAGGDRRGCAAHTGGRPLHPGPPDRGDRAFRSPVGFFDAVPEPVVASDPDRGNRSRRRSRACDRCSKRWVRMWTRWNPPITTLFWPSRVTRRT